jgi:hypothetical protein
MMTYREKSAAASLAITAIAFAAYGFWAFQQPRSTGDAVMALIGLIVVQIVVQVIAHVLFAVQARPEGVDERDRMVERLAQRNAYFVLFGSVWAVLGMALEALPGLTIAYGLIATIVLAELVRFASQLFYYRRGA